jgi:hypothetical protein
LNRFERHIFVHLPVEFVEGDKVSGSPLVINRRHDIEAIMSSHLNPLTRRRDVHFFPFRLLNRAALFSSNPPQNSSGSTPRVRRGGKTRSSKGFRVRRGGEVLRVLGEKRDFTQRGAVCGAGGSLDSCLASFDSTTLSRIDRKNISRYDASHSSAGVRGDQKLSDSQVTLHIPASERRHSNSALNVHVGDERKPPALL